MDKHKDSKRKDDDQSREPGRHSQAPEPERRYPDSNRPDTLRPGPGERERKDEGERMEGARQSDESRKVSVEDDDEVEAADDDDDEIDVADDDDEDIDDEDIDDEVMPAKPVK